MRNNVIFVIGSLFLTSCQAWEPLTTKDLVPAETMERIKAEKAAAEQNLHADRATLQMETFGILADFVGNTYRGEPIDGSSEAVADIQEWAWADEEEPSLLIRHSLEDGSYGGDTIVRRDSATGKLSYVYTTTAGFVTRGTFEVSEEGTWEAEEDVEGHTDISKVRSSGHVREDGALISSSEYLKKDGTWVTGHGFVYRKSDRTLAEHLDKPAGWKVWKR